MIDWHFFQIVGKRNGKKSFSKKTIKSVWYQKMIWFHRFMFQYYCHWNFTDGMVYICSLLLSHFYLIMLSYCSNFIKDRIEWYHSSNYCTRIRYNNDLHAQNYAVKFRTVYMWIAHYEFFVRHFFRWDSRFVSARIVFFLVYQYYHHDNVLIIHSVTLCTKFLANLHHITPLLLIIVKTKWYILR